MSKTKDKWDSMSMWQKRLAVLSFFSLLLTGSVERGMAGYNHFATNERVDQVANLVAEVKVERRIEWLEKQVVTCADEEKKGNQTPGRKINCKKWNGELDRKYKELEKFQT